MGCEGKKSDQFISKKNGSFVIVKGFGYLHCRGMGPFSCSECNHNCYSLESKPSINSC